MHLGSFLDRAAMIKYLETESANLESVQAKVTSPSPSPFPCNNNKNNLFAMLFCNKHTARLYNSIHYNMGIVE